MEFHASLVFSCLLEGWALAESLFALAAKVERMAVEQIVERIVGGGIFEEGTCLEAAFRTQLRELMAVLDMALQGCLFSCGL